MRWWETDKDWDSFVCVEISNRMMQKEKAMFLKVKMLKNEEDEERTKEV